MFNKIMEVKTVKKLAVLPLVLFMLISNTISVLADSLTPNEQMQNITNQFKEKLNELQQEGYGKEYNLQVPSVTQKELPDYKNKNVQDVYKNTFPNQNTSLEKQSIIPDKSFFANYLSAIKAEMAKVEQVRSASQGKSSPNITLQVPSLQQKKSPQISLKSLPLTLANTLFTNLNDKKAEFEESMPSQDEITAHLEGAGPNGYGSVSAVVDHSKWNTWLVSGISKAITAAKDAIIGNKDVPIEDRIKQFFTNALP